MGIYIYTAKPDFNGQLRDRFKLSANVKCPLTRMKFIECNVHHGKIAIQFMQIHIHTNIIDKVKSWTLIIILLTIK